MRCKFDLCSYVIYGFFIEIYWTASFICENSLSFLFFLLESNVKRFFYIFWVCVFAFYCDCEKYFKRIFDSFRLWIMKSSMVAKFLTALTPPARDYWTNIANYWSENKRRILIYIPLLHPLHSILVWLNQDLFVNEKKKNQWRQILIWTLVSNRITWLILILDLFVAINQKIIMEKKN